MVTGPAHRPPKRATATRTWSRLVGVLLCAMLSLHAIGAAEFLGAMECEQTCPDDDAKGNCAPYCDDCLCCAHLPSVAPPLGTSLTAPRNSATRSTPLATSPGEAYPRGIEHVPKSLLG